MENFQKVIEYYGGIENVLTHEGFQLFNLMNNKCIEISSKWHPIIKSLNYKNQPYNFTYQEFIKLNPITND